MVCVFCKASLEEYSESKDLGYRSKGLFTLATLHFTAVPTFYFYVLKDQTSSQRVVWENPHESNSILHIPVRYIN